MPDPHSPQELGPEQLVRAEIESFVHNQAFDRLASLFGVDTLPDDTQQRLTTLQEIAAEHWDFRKGAERQAVEWNDELLDQEGSEQWNIIFEAADQLGMVQDTEPVVTSPDFLVIYGGANMAPYYRLRYGLGKTSGGTVAYLGSSRKVSDAEREKAKDYAPDAQTEFDLGCGAIETLLGATEYEEFRDDRGNDTWITRVYTYTDDEGQTRHAFALSTPHMIGEERATTYDNLRTFADAARLSEHPGATIVAVTTGFYTQGQRYPGLQELTLRYGAHVETIGHSAEYAGGKRTASQLLQEKKAGLDATARVLARLPTQK